MAWPHKLYVATRTLGVYYTDNFSGPDTQPTWTAVNGGLPATDVRQFALDPFNPAGKQYLLLETARTLYRRDNGGNWASILTSAAVATLVECSGLIHWFCTDETIAGRLWIVFVENIGNNSGLWGLYSDDYGETWNKPTKAASHDLDYTSRSDGIKAQGNTVYIHEVTQSGWGVRYSNDKGSTWSGASNPSASFNAIALNVLNPNLLYMNSGAGAIRTLTNQGVVTLIRDDIGFTAADGIWFAAADENHQRAVYNSRIYSTTDKWVNINTPSAIAPAPYCIAPWAGSDENNILVGLTLDTNPYGGLQPHVIGVLYGEDDTTAVGIAGTNCDTSPYTDSIPMTCGGAAIGGIVAVNEGNPIRLLSITRKTDLAEYASRVYPRGNDVSLIYTTRTASGEYTLDATAGYIANGTAEALYGRRDSVQYFDISLPDSTGSESEQRVYGANALYDAALEWLGQHDSVATFYSIVVTGYDAPPKPGETIHVLTTTTVDGADVIEIDDDFNIVEASYGIDADGLPIATLEITDIERRAVNGERLLANAIVSAGRKSSGTGSTVTTLTSSASGTASIIGGEINGTTIGLLDPEAGRFTTLQVDGTADIAVIASGTATDGQVLTADGTGGAAWENPPAGGAVDAADVTYTPAVATDWDSDTDPGNADDALDQLAARVDDLETAGGGAITVEEIDGTPSVASVTKIKVTNGTLTDNTGGTVTLDFGSAATDGAAIHDNTAGEIHAITNKATPDNADELVIEDSADSWNKKRVAISALPTGESADPSKIILTNSYASRPAAGTAGRIFLPNNSYYLERDNGTAWIPWGPIFPMTPPVSGDFGWVNQGTATLTTTYGGMVMYAPAVSGDQLRILKKATPATPYTISVFVLMAMHAVNYNQIGLCWRQSSDGKLATFFFSGENSGSLRVAKFSSPTSWSANYFDVTMHGMLPYVWLRLADDGTNRKCSWSMDGRNWIQLHSVGRTDYLTPDEVGMVVNSNHGTYPVIGTFLSWKEE